jgi:predicted Fe-Mo cluster-binding NifX family protein
MKAAFASWNNRMAPQFDAARHVHIVELRVGAIVAEHEEAFGTRAPVKKVHRLVEWGVDTLVCGAISRPIQALLAAQEIRVVPYVAGDLPQVIQAWIHGNLEAGGFAMPGHRGAPVQARREASPRFP